MFDLTQGWAIIYPGGPKEKQKQAGGPSQKFKLSIYIFWGVFVDSELHRSHKVLKLSGCAKIRYWESVRVNLQNIIYSFSVNIQTMRNMKHS